MSSLDLSPPSMSTMAVPRLRTTFMWTFAGNFVYALCQWGMISALAKLGNSAVVGQFALGLAIAAPIFMFSNLQLRAVQATDARSEHEFGHYFTLRLATSLCALGVVAAIAFAGRYDPTTKSVLLLVAVAKAIESLSDVIAGLLQKHERLDQVAIGLMLKGVFSVTAFTAVFRVTERLTLAVASLVCTWAAVGLAYDLPRALRLERTFRRFFSADFHRIWQLVALSVPLGLVMAMMSLNLNVPRYVIAHWMGPRALGVFVALAYLVIASNLVVNALGQSASARLSRMLAQGELDKFKVLMRRLILFGASLGMIAIPVAWMFGRPVLTVLYTPEYADYIGTLLIMTAALVPIAIWSFLGYGITAARSFKPQVLIFSLSLLTNLLTCLLLVPSRGLVGAAIALLTSALVQTGGMAFVLMNTVHKRKMLMNKVVLI